MTVATCASDTRWAAADADRFRTYATELVALAPDVILSSGTPSAAALQQATRTVPIVFVNVVDPVGAGFVDSLAQPGGNATGLTLYEYGIRAEWLESVLRDFAGCQEGGSPSGLSAGIGQFGAIQKVAPSFGMEVRTLAGAPREIESDRRSLRAHAEMVA